MTLQANWSSASQFIQFLTTLSAVTDVEVVVTRHGYHLEETNYTRLPTGAEEIVVFVGGKWYLRDVKGNVEVSPKKVLTRGMVKPSKHDPVTIAGGDWKGLETLWAGLTEGQSRLNTSSVDVVISYGLKVAGVTLVPGWVGRLGSESGQIPMTSHEAKEKWELFLDVENRPINLHTNYLTLGSLKESLWQSFGRAGEALPE